MLLSTAPAAASTTDEQRKHMQARLVQLEQNLATLKVGLKVGTS